MVSSGADVLSPRSKFARNFAALSNWIDLDQRNQTAIDNMTRSIRQAQRVTAFATNQLTVLDVDGTALTYAYDPVARTLTRTKGADSAVLLREVFAGSMDVPYRDIDLSAFRHRLVGVQHDVLDHLGDLAFVRVDKPGILARDLAAGP